jgi:hypothetical protein
MELQQEQHEQMVDQVVDSRAKEIPVDVQMVEEE